MQKMLGPVEVYQLLPDVVDGGASENPEFTNQFDSELLPEIEEALFDGGGNPVYTPNMMDETINVLEGGESVQVPVLQVVHGRVFIEPMNVIRTCDGRLWVESDKIG